MADTQNGAAPNTEADTQPTGQDDQDKRTVQRLRFGVGCIGLLLPLALPAGNWIFVQFGHQTQILPSSMSSSYYTATRNIFVGSLCALGVFLIGYRFNKRDDRWSTVAGFFAIGVAVCPTAPTVPTTYQSTVGYVHLSFAGVLLCGLAVFCISSFRDPSVEERRTANHAYLTAGITILTFVALAVAAGATRFGNSWTLTPLYICETVSVWAFGASWLAAALELGPPSASRDRWHRFTARLAPVIPHMPHVLHLPHLTFGHRARRL